MVSVQKDILLVPEDSSTVLEVMEEQLQQFYSLGYEVVRINPICFQLLLVDGEILVYWENGRIYQEIFEEVTRC